MTELMRELDYRRRVSSLLVRLDHIAEHFERWDGRVAGAGNPDIVAALPESVTLGPLRELRPLLIESSVLIDEIDVDYATNGSMAAHFEERLKALKDEEGSIPSAVRGRCVRIIRSAEQFGTRLDENRAAALARLIAPVRSRFLI